MAHFPRTPLLVKGGLVQVDPESSRVLRIITLQYNPDSLTRSLSPQVVGESGERSAAMRFKGPPVETIQLEAEVDATDRLEDSNNFPPERLSVLPILFALESILYPSSAELLHIQEQVSRGVLTIIPSQAPLLLFVWSAKRIIPVRLTAVRVVEEAFDPQLNPIRARISLEMRVLSVSDLGFDNKGGTLYMVYQQKKEEIASWLENGNFNMLGIGGIP